MSETSEIDAVIDKEGKLKWIIKPKQVEEDYDSVLEPADYLLQEDSTQWFLHNDLAINIKTSADSVIISVYNDRGKALGDVLLHEVLDANKSYDTKK
tara:strand:- start:2550 stop:2840 length:291 start_codon:yes stop_codon:yes gene_type:complete